MTRYESWGRYKEFSKFSHRIQSLDWTSDKLYVNGANKPLLPYGLGRSYGDSCLNDGGILVDITGLNRFLSFDIQSGVLRCEAGVTLQEINELIVLQGWFLSVTPGTQYVTIGGAIANDIHGKNHATGGAFGCYVRRFELLRSNGERLICSPTENGNWFRATIGGLGLTGIILWAELQLKRIRSPFFDVESIQFRNLDEFFEIAIESDEAGYEYTVAWLDCLAKGKSLGRGVFQRGNNASPPFERTMRIPKSRTINVPFDAPNFAINFLAMRAFNLVWYHKQLRRVQRKIIYYVPFFYPLDMIGHWNRAFGKRGFFQYQFVIPYNDDYAAIRHILHKISNANLLPTLNVFKTFGDLPSPGLLSFPRKGVTLAIDFPNQGQRTLDFLNELDELVRTNGGVVYPAKDARMSAENFQAFYPQWQEFARYVDPMLSSSFWRRVTGPVGKTPQAV
jgi:FAD/FMN-containing dehydrogenase